MRQENLSISTAQISFGQLYAVKLLSPGSPASVWLKLRSSSVDKLEKDLTSFYSASKIVSTLPSIGSFVICLHDAKFCRGKVANILNINKSFQVEIVLVDYGILATVSVDQIYPIQEQFCSAPAIGLFCSVHQLEPLNDEGWDIDTIIEFFVPHCQSSHLFATFHSFLKDECRGETFISQHCADFSVSLESREPGDAKLDIGLAMIRKGLAKSSLVNKPEPASVAESAHSDDASCVEVAIDVPVCKPGDQGLMEKFLSSFEQQLKLDYQFEAVLQQRTSPFSDANSLDCSIKFLFSYVFSPSYFCIHLSDEIATRVEPLILRLNAVYESAPLIPVTTKPEIGSFWVTKEEEKNIWSRVEVIGVDYAQKRVNVLFVDWGHVGVVDFSQLQPLVKEFVEVPCCAYRCCLAGIFPYRTFMECRDWPEESTEKFVSLCYRKTEMTALVSSYLKEEESLSVVVMYDDSDDKYSINELLVRSKVASSDVFIFHDVDTGTDNDVDNEPITCAMPEWDPMAVDFHSSSNTAVLDTENYDSVTTGYIPKDEERICRFFRAKGSCYKGIKCDQLHCNPSNPHTFTQDGMEVYIDVPELPSPTPGMYLSIQVTVVLNSFRFYCVLPHGMQNLECRFKDDDEENLETLQAAMQREYSDNYYRHRLALNPSAGDIVIAKSSEDNRWYRGRVMREEENDEFEVFYVDFGNCESVHLRNLCSMLPRFNHLPAQAVEMFLNGVKKNETTEGRDLLVKLVKNKDLVARVIHTFPYITVDLYDTTGPKEVDIAQELINRKVVEADKKKIFCMQSRTKIPG